MQIKGNFIGKLESVTAVDRLADQGVRVAVDVAAVMHLAHVRDLFGDELAETWFAPLVHRTTKNKKGEERIEPVWLVDSLPKPGKKCIMEMHTAHALDLTETAQPAFGSIKPIADSEGITITMRFGFDATLDDAARVLAQLGQGVTVKLAPSQMDLPLAGG